LLHASISSFFWLFYGR